jgi:hypothetical protein
MELIAIAEQHPRTIAMGMKGQQQQTHGEAWRELRGADEAWRQPPAGGEAGMA